MKQSDITRRLLLRSGASAVMLGFAGCAFGGSDIQDTDGDGVIDSEDYAPRDPDVQEKSDVEEMDTETATETPSSGVIYAPGSEKIVRITADGAVETVVRGVNVKGLTVAPDGTFWTTRQPPLGEPAYIRHINRQGEVIERFNPNDKGIRGIDLDHNGSLGNQGHLYVVAHKNEQIFEFTRDGTLENKYGTPAFEIVGISTDEQGYLWMTNQEADIVYKADISGGETNIVDSWSVGLSSLSDVPEVQTNPHLKGIEIVGSEVWVTDGSGSDIYRFSKQGELQSRIEEIGSRRALSAPTDQGPVEETGTNQSEIDGLWPMFQVDAANTGDGSTATGPTSNVTERWNFGTDGQISSGPVVADGTVYIGNHVGTVYAIAAATGKQEWIFDAPQGPMTTPAVDNGTVYIGSRDNHVYAVDVATGDPEWTFSPENSVVASPTVVDGAVFFGSHADAVHALDAADGTELWRFDGPDWEIRTTPAVVDGTVYVGSHDSNVYAIEATTGDLQWSFQAGTRVYSPPTVVEGTVYTASRDHNVYALDADTGDELWAFDTGEWVHASPAVADGTVYVGDHGRGGSNHVYAVDAATGSQDWSFEVGGQVPSSPAVVDNTVYVGSKDKNMYAIDADSGSQQWVFETGSQVTSSPAVVDGTVYFGSQDGNIYALSEQ